MKDWENYSEQERRKILTYKKYLEIDSLSEDMQTEMLTLAKYCVENDLCVSEIPESIQVDESIIDMAKKMSPFTFAEFFNDKIFFENDKEITVRQLLEKYNEQKDLIGIYLNRDENVTVKVSSESETYAKKCAYIAKEFGLPEYMGELLVSEIRLGDKSRPDIINKAVNIGLIGERYRIE